MKTIILALLLSSTVSFANITRQEDVLVTENHQLAQAVCSFRPQLCSIVSTPLVMTVESLNSWEKIIRAVITSLSEDLRSSDIQSERDQINNLLADLVPHYIHLTSKAIEIRYSK